MQIKITKPITDLQTDNYNKLKADLYEYIITTNDFPEWKQANYADTWATLSIKQLSTSLTTAEQTTLDYIASVRTWKDDLLAERDRVKTAVFAATTMAEIRTAIDSFNYTPKP